MDEVPPLEPEKEYTATLTGAQWVNIMALLMGTGARLTAAGQPIDKVLAGTQLLDTGVEIVRQIDPTGWDATERLGHGHEDAG